MSGYHQINTRKREISTSTCEKLGRNAGTIEYEPRSDLSITAVIREFQGEILDFPRISFGFALDFPLICIGFPM